MLRPAIKLRPTGDMTIRFLVHLRRGSVRFAARVYILFLPLPILFSFCPSHPPGLLPDQSAWPLKILPTSPSMVVTLVRRTQDNLLSITVMRQDSRVASALRPPKSTTTVQSCSRSTSTMRKSPEPKSMHMRATLSSVRSLGLSAALSGIDSQRAMSMKSMLSSATILLQQLTTTGPRSPTSSGDRPPVLQERLAGDPSSS